MFKRILALLLAGSLALTALMPMEARAAEDILDVCSIPMAEDTTEAKSPYEILDNDVLMAQNENLELYLQENAMIVKIRSKETGYIWSSAVPFDMTMGMSTEWQRMSQSLLTMDYISKGVVKRSPLKHGEAKQPKITKTEDGFEATVQFYEAKATVTICFSLEEESLVVRIPDESIEIKEGNLVNRIYVMPFFGASYQDNLPGYMFVPDGAGALMHYQQSRPFRTYYQQKVYGADRAVSQTIGLGQSGNTVGTGRIMVPVFGVVQGVYQNGFAGIIRNGGEYAEIIANPSGNIVDYHWIGSAFLYNEQYWQPTGKSDGYYGNQPEQNEVNLELEYRFLHGEKADYVGMANAYKEYLRKENPQLSRNEAGTAAGLKLDAFMGEPKKALIGRKLKVMTTVSDVISWVDELKELSVENLVITLNGFEKGGKNGHKYGRFSMDKAIGTAKEVQQLGEQLGNRLYIQSDFGSGYENQFAKSQLRTGMNGSQLKQAENQPIFQNRVWATDQAAAQAVRDYCENAPVKNLALEGFAVSLNGDYHRNNSITRKESLEAELEILRQTGESAENISLEAPNFYAFAAGDVESVFNLPMENTQYSYFTETVPFLQIVLSGYVDCYSEYQNYTTNTIQDVLKLIDYNTYPSYILTEEPSTELANTNMSSLYSSQFDVWKNHIYSHYIILNEALSKVSGAQIVKRHVPQEGVSVTEYDNGVCIVVNYLEEEVTVEGSRVPAMSAITYGKEGTE